MHVVEHAFGRGQKRPFRRLSTLGRAGFEREANAHNGGRESGDGSVAEVDLQGLPARGESRLSRGDSPLLDNSTSMRIPKEKYTKMEILTIQNVLSRDYHFQKWQLVEVLELQERELNSVAFRSTFSDTVNQLME